MLGHGAGIGYTGPVDNFSLVTGSEQLDIWGRVLLGGLEDGSPPIGSRDTVVWLVTYDEAKYRFYIFLVCFYKDDINAHYFSSM